MIKLFLLLALVFLLAVFVWQLKNHLARDKKIEELREARLESHLTDIDKEIAEEKARQQEVSSEIDELNSQGEIDKEDDNNG